MEADVDVLLPESIEFRRYHYWIFIILTCTAIVSGWHHFAFFFIGGRHMDHWCTVPGLANRTDIYGRKFGIPVKFGIPIVENPRESLDPSRCERYDVDFTRYTDDELKLWNWTELAAMNNTYDYVSCESWQYDTESMDSTLLKQFGMICGNRQWMLSFLEYVEIMGAMFGCLVFGLLADRYGRRFILTMTLTTMCACGSVLPFMNNYYAVLWLRFLLTAGTLSTFFISFVLLVELIPSKSLRAVGLNYHAGFGIGMTIMAAIAFWFRDHVIIQLVIGFSPIILIFAIRIIPESPRWLRVTSRYYKYLAVMQKLVASGNDQNNITDESIKLLSVDDDESQTQLSLVSIFVNRNFRRTILHSSITWFTLGAIRQVLLASSNFLVLNVFNNGVLIAVCQLLAPIMAKHSFAFMPGLQLRHLCLWSQAVGSVTVLILVSVLKHPELDNFSRFLLVMARMILPVAYIGLYYDIVVLMPTRLRCTALGLLNCVYDLGRMVAMGLQEGATTEVTLFLPMLCMGLCGLFGGVQHAFVPERNEEKISDSFSECQDYLKRVCFIDKDPPKRPRGNHGIEEPGERSTGELHTTPVDPTPPDPNPAPYTPDPALVTSSKEAVVLETIQEVVSPSEDKACDFGSIKDNEISARRTSSNESFRKFSITESVKKSNESLTRKSNEPFRQIPNDALNSTDCLRKNSIDSNSSHSWSGRVDL